MDPERDGEGAGAKHDAPWWVKVWIVAAFVLVMVTVGPRLTWWGQVLKGLSMPLLLVGVWLGIYLAARGENTRG